MIKNRISAANPYVSAFYKCRGWKRGRLQRQAIVIAEKLGRILVPSVIIILSYPQLLELNLDDIRVVFRTTLSHITVS